MILGVLSLPFPGHSFTFLYMLRSAADPMLWLMRLIKRGFFDRLQVLDYVASFVDLTKEELAEVSYKNAVLLFSYDGSKVLQEN